HSTVIKPGTMPDMKAVALDWADFLKDYLPEDKWAKLHKLVDDVPYDMHMMHGDYHIKNVMLQNGEVLLIDMDTLCHGHPIFELASMFNAYAGYSDVDHNVVKDFIGIPYEVSVPFWRESLRLYLGTDDEDRINEVEEKAKLIGFVRIMRRRIRRNGFDTEEGRKEIENAKAHILELVDKLDTLTF
ncbi:MAG: phosphotransferase, partial [Firmicutes bacterium]|nr:phosphotransferase [Bacillota bacterium]